MARPKFILLNGFAGSGKTTIAAKYIENHPLALAIEGDELIVHLGQWTKHEPEARKAVFTFIKSLAQAHLQTGHDVIVPSVLTNHEHAAEIQTVAHNTNADYYEIYTDKQTAINRLWQRGTWGEAGLDPLSEKDVPEIESLYDHMEVATARRGDMQRIDIVIDNIGQTYTNMMKYIQSN
ncbi:MAG: AAA family ATPase [Candidatus Saccharimonadales bacterium]